MVFFFFFLNMRKFGFFLFFKFNPEKKKASIKWIV
ncbi:unnamed protein product, partial [Arabidopsis halleri]